MAAAAKSAVSDIEQLVLKYWFDGYCSRSQPLPASAMAKWFSGKPEVDEEIRTNFEKHVDSALSNDTKVESLKLTPQGSLSLILLLDQFTRNIYRNTKKMFAGDTKALALSHAMIKQKWDMELIPLHRCWIYLPLEHSETLSDQHLCIEKTAELTKLTDINNGEKKLFQTMLDYAYDHLHTIERFKRFPYRNKLLDRTSTPEELEYMKDGKGDYISAKKE